MQFENIVTVLVALECICSRQNNGLLKKALKPGLRCPGAMEWTTLKTGKTNCCKGGNLSIVGGTRCGAWRGHTRQGCARASGICDVDGVAGMGDVGRQGVCVRGLASRLYSTRLFDLARDGSTSFVSPRAEDPNSHLYPSHTVQFDGALAERGCSTDPWGTQAPQREQCQGP
jgi:hypothetical protein